MRFFFLKNRLSSSSKMLTNYHGLQHRPIRISAQLGNSLLSPALSLQWLFVNVLLWALYGKAVSWSAIKVDRQHKNQLFFVSVITQAKTANTIPNTKLNSQP